MKVSQKEEHPCTLQKQNGIHSPIQQAFLERKHCPLQHKGQLDPMPPLQDLDEGSGPQAACRKTSRDLRRSLMGLFLSKREAEACVKNSIFGLDLNHNSTTKDSAILDRSLICFKLWCLQLWGVIVRIKLADSWD